MEEYTSPWGEDELSAIIRKGMSGQKPTPKPTEIPASQPQKSKATSKPTAEATTSEKRTKQKSRSKSRSSSKKEKLRRKSRSASTKKRAQETRKKSSSRSKSSKKEKNKKSRSVETRKKSRSRSGESRKKKDRSKSKNAERHSKSDARKKRERSGSREKRAERDSKRKRSRSRSRRDRRRESRSLSRKKDSRRERKRSHSRTKHRRRSESKNRKEKIRNESRSSSRKKDSKASSKKEKKGKSDSDSSASSSSSDGENDEENQENSSDEKEGFESVSRVKECPNTENKYHRCTKWCEMHWKNEQAKTVSAKPQPPKPLLILPLTRRLTPAIVNTGSCSERGMRSTNEDMLWVIPSFKVPGQNLTPHPLAFLGVFDGHSGVGTVNYVYKAVQAFLKLHLSKGSSMETALFAAFKDANANVLKDGSGSTACCVVVCKGTGRMWTANCGDSRAILSKNGAAVQLTRDHKISDPEEKQRLRDLGAEFVESNGAEYVKYHKPDVKLGLSVARSLGDHHFNEEKDIISGTPDLTAQMLTSQDEFIVVACDGVWDVLQNQQVVDFVGAAMKEEETLDTIAANLAKHAMSLGSADNISIIIAKV